MCAKADYREGFRVMAVELRRLLRDFVKRWQVRAAKEIDRLPTPARR